MKTLMTFSLLFLALACETGQATKAKTTVNAEKVPATKVDKQGVNKKTTSTKKIEKQTEEIAIAVPELKLTPPPKNPKAKCIQDPLKHAHNETKDEKDWTSDRKAPVMTRTDEAIDLDGDGVAEYIYSGGNQFNKVSPFLIYLSNKGCPRFAGQHYGAEGVGPQNLKGPRTDGVLDLIADSSNGCAGWNRAYTSSIYDKKTGLYQPKENFNCTFCIDDLTSEAPISDNANHIKRCQETFPDMYTDWKKAFKK